MGTNQLLKLQVTKQKLIKMHIKLVSCVVALLFAVANARYTGVGPAGKCNGVQFFPQCSPEQYLQNQMQCNRNLYSGYPYQNTGQCMSNVDQWIQCMQMDLGKCMASNCPSYITQFDGFQQFMPIINRFMSANSLDGIYQAIDGTISDVFNQFNFNIPAQLDQIRRNGVKNLVIPLPGYNGVTIDQYIQEMICPVPGQMPRSFQNLLPTIQSTWQLLSSMGATDTSQYVPFCDGDFTSYIVNNVLDHLRGFYRATSRSEYCRVQKSAANFVDTALNKKCDYNQLASILSQVGIPSSVISMAKNSAQLMYDASGCSGNQGYSSNSYQQSSYQSQNPSYYNNFGSSFQNLFGNSNFQNLVGNAFQRFNNRGY